MTDTEILDALSTLGRDAVIVIDPSGSARVNIGNATPALESDLRTALTKALTERR